MLSAELGLSLGDVSGSLQRATRAALLAPSGLSPTKGRPIKRLIVNRPSLIEFAAHGIKYVFVPDRGKLARGTPTAHGVNPLRDLLSEVGPPPVWPDSRGSARGESFSPLHACAVIGARNDDNLYTLLALVDAIRGGSARERELANQLFVERINGRS
jgi:hypothetical protein